MYVYTTCPTSKARQTRCLTTIFNAIMEKLPALRRVFYIISQESTVGRPLFERPVIRIYPRKLFLKMNCIVDKKIEIIFTIICRKCLMSNSYHLLLWNATFFAYVYRMIASIITNKHTKCVNDLIVLYRNHKPRVFYNTNVPKNVKTQTPSISYIDA